MFHRWDHYSVTCQNQTIRVCIIETMQWHNSILDPQLTHFGYCRQHYFFHPLSRRYEKTFRAIFLKAMLFAFYKLRGTLLILLKIRWLLRLTTHGLKSYRMNWDLKKKRLTFVGLPVIRCILIEFLMGLSKSYNAIWGQVHLINSLSDVA